MRTRSAIPLAALSALCLAACGGPLTDADEASAEGVTGQDASQDASGQAISHPPRHLYTLQHAPFPGSHPTALVHLGKGFKAAGPLNLVVHFHGWSNCIANDVEASGSACTPGGPVRTAHNLIAQLDASGANAALVAVERAFDQATSVDGRLSEAGFFRQMILELLPQIGLLAGRTYTEADLGRLVLSSHSGGYIAVGDVLEKGGLTANVRTVLLFDSLYGSVPQYTAWLKGDLAHRRLSIVYTDGGGTKANSQALATQVQGWARAAGLAAGAVLDDRTTGTLAPAAFGAQLFFKRSALAHDATAQYYFSRLVAGAVE
jgi:hypothetical protein